jgi:hypothetical protein
MVPRATGTPVATDLPRRGRPRDAANPHFPAQRLRTLAFLRRHATMVATVLDMITRLTDDDIALMRDARAINDKVGLLARLGVALIEVKKSGADLQVAATSAIGWDKLAHSVEEAKRLARPDKAALLALAAHA